MNLFLLRHKRLLWALPVAAVLLIVGLGFLPWHSWIETRLKATLETQGLRPVELTLTDIGWSALTLGDIKIGAPVPLVLKNITIKYAPLDLLFGKIHTLHVSGLDLEAHQANGRWGVLGLESMNQSADAAPFSLATLQDQLIALPFDEIYLDDSQLRLIAPAGKVTIPVQIVWQKNPIPTFSLKANDLKFEGKNLAATVGAVDLTLAFSASDKTGTGRWHIAPLVLSGDNLDVQPLALQGSFALKTGGLVIDGTGASPDAATKADFQITLPLAASQQTQLLIRSAQFPWKEGMLSTQQVSFALGTQKDITLPLRIEHVSTNALLHLVAGDRASATGTLSGTLPLTISPDGTLTLHQGLMKAEGPGQITLTPDLIPGDNPQVALVREVVKNLHYANLAVTADTAQDDKLAITLSIEGNNPDVLSGRAVTMNVRLTGDLLSFIQQNLLWLSDPHKFLERGSHVQN